MASQSPPAEALPDAYDAVLGIDRLVHGQHNPRRVTPSEALRRSIERDGLQRPLIVRPDPEQDVYHITDGWQRYQAATNLGWEALPVQVYETPLAALEATEAASIVREWSTYEWAQYCQSVATEIDASSEKALSERVARRTVKSPRTVRRYLAALSLPEDVHPLLQDGPEGSEQAWAALKHYNADVKRYRGLPWRVAARLGRQAAAADVGRSRVVALAANAVQYETEDAFEFVECGVEHPDLPLRTVHRRVQRASQHTEYLQVPSVAVTMSDAEKEAIMRYCADQRRPLSEVVTGQVRDLANELVDQ